MSEPPPAVKPRMMRIGRAWARTEGAAAPVIGEKVRLVPGHCDPTVDRYDWYVGVRGGRVESVWPVAARGAMA